jgi:hypothetical protein
MLKEFALQPDVVSCWTTCRFLMDKFGYGRGRVISRYPKKWTRLAYDALNGLGPMEKKRIEVGLTRLKDALYPRYNEWDPARDWVDNALEEHRQRPFCAIITDNACGKLPGVIREEDLDEEDEPRWKAEVQRRIERTAAEMAACADTLLRNAKQILLVDPHFNPQAQRFRRPFEAFLRAAVNREPGIPIERVEVHTGESTGGTKAFFDGECQKYLPRHIPAGLKVRVVRWEQKYMHNRYVLTERGGLKYGTGLDDHDGGTVAHDMVDLLTPEPYAQILKLREFR